MKPSFNLILPFRVAAALGLLGVAAGAFGAHALKGRLSPEMLEVWQTAAHYQLIHAIMGCVSCSLGTMSDDNRYRIPAWLFISGICLFSGSLDALALSGIKLLGAVTPLGGIAFMAGWGMLIFIFGSKTQTTSKA